MIRLLVSTMMVLTSLLMVGGKTADGDTLGTIVWSICMALWAAALAVELFLWLERRR